MLSPKEILIARANLRNSIRSFLTQKAYLEIDTPVMVPCPGAEAHLRYFSSDWVDQKRKKNRLWLRSSPEIHMKRSLSFGLKSVFQIGPSFRNYGEHSKWHHPEFTMLEWYKCHTTWDSYIKEAESLLLTSLDDLRSYVKCPLVLPKMAERISVSEAFERFAHVTLKDGDQDLASKARLKGCISVNDSDDFETAFFKILIDKVEPELTKRPWVCLYDYPPSQAALARIEGGFAKRFEFYISGVEISNGFYELVDPTENLDRFDKIKAFRTSLNYETPAKDSAFFAALNKGIPSSFGKALGFDRWLALILGEKSINAVLPFREDFKNF